MSFGDEAECQKKGTSGTNGGTEVPRHEWPFGRTESKNI